LGSPSVYLLYGDDPLAIREQLHEFKLKLDDPAEFNLQRFQAGNIDLDIFHQACLALPFLSDRRLIVVEDAEDLPRDEGSRQRFEQILGQLPPTSRVVLIEWIVTDRQKTERDQLKRSIGWAWAEAHPAAAFVRRFACPRGPAFARWLQERARSLGGTIEAPASQLLAERLGEDLLLAEQELLKLLEFTDRQRPVTSADVQRLSSDYSEVDIFAVVDQLGAGSAWIGQLEQLLEDRDPGYVFSMLARQFRLLLKARAALDAGEDPVAAVQAGESRRPPEFVASKISRQARSLSLPALKSIHRRLMQLDLAVKKGEAELSLDLLPMLVGFTR